MASLTQSPIQIHVDPSLHMFNISLAQYLKTNPQFDKLVVSAFIFHPSNGEALAIGQKRRLLIVQRAAHERSYANLWEIPGGSSDVHDPTILHSLAREVFEETGLKMKKVLRQVGDKVEFTTGWGSSQKRWAKLTFEIEVAEIESQGPHSAFTADHDASKADLVNQKHDHESTQGSSVEAQDVRVTIDPKEHQSFAWVALEDLKMDKYAIVTPKQRELMLEAFNLGENYQA